MKTLSTVAVTCALLAIVAGIIDAPRAHAHPYELLASNSSAQNGGQDNGVATFRASLQFPPFHPNHTLVRPRAGNLADYCHTD
jgi:hypothetical protein